MEPAELVATLFECGAKIEEALESVDDWRRVGERRGQYSIDLVADEVGVGFLTDQGFGVLSEESGLHFPERELLAVIDPIDGSTNASRHLPWYATSICLLDGDGPLAAVVVNQATNRHYQAARGTGAFCDGAAIRPSTVTRLDEAMVALSGYPPAHLGWSQYRALGAIALDLCAVAEGSIDAYLDCVRDAHGPWDYLAGMFICQEAGALVFDVQGRDLVTRGFGDRRSPVAAGTSELVRLLEQSFRSLDQR